MSFQNPNLQAATDSYLEAQEHSQEAYDTVWLALDEYETALAHAGKVLLERLEVSDCKILLFPVVE